MRACRERVKTSVWQNRGSYTYFISMPINSRIQIKYLDKKIRLLWRCITQIAIWQCSMLIGRSVRVWQGNGFWDKTHLDWLVNGCFLWLPHAPDAVVFSPWSENSLFYFRRCNYQVDMESDILIQLTKDVQRSI